MAHVKFGEAIAPETYNASLQSEVNMIFKQGFIATYRWVGLLSAGLAFLSAGIAFFMVEGKKGK